LASGRRSGGCEPTALSPCNPEPGKLRLVSSRKGRGYSLRDGLARRTKAAWFGSSSVCSWVVSVAEVDEGHVARESSVTAEAIGSRARQPCLNACPKLGRSGKAETPVAAHEARATLACCGVDGTCRRKASRVFESLGIGVSGVEGALVRFGEPGAVRVNGSARQEASVVTSPRCAGSSTGWRALRLGKPDTFLGRAGMTTAGSASPNALLFGTEDTACGSSVTLWKREHRPPYKRAE
jgi:hypothetical protein